MRGGHSTEAVLALVRELQAGESSLPRRSAIHLALSGKWGERYLRHPELVREEAEPMLEILLDPPSDFSASMVMGIAVEALESMGPGALPLEPRIRELSSSGGRRERREQASRWARLLVALHANDSVWLRSRVLEPEGSSFGEALRSAATPVLLRRDLKEVGSIAELVRVWASARCGQGIGPYSRALRIFAPTEEVAEALPDWLGRLSSERSCAKVAGLVGLNAIAYHPSHAAVEKALADLPDGMRTTLESLLDAPELELPLALRRRVAVALGAPLPETEEGRSGPPPSADDVRQRLWELGRDVNASDRLLAPLVQAAGNDESALEDLAELLAFPAHGRRVVLISLQEPSPTLLPLRGFFELLTPVVAAERSSTAALDSFALLTRVRLFLERY